MTSGSQWRWVDRRGVQRTLTAEALHEALRAGRLGRDVPVWQEGMPAFEPVYRVAAFTESIRMAPETTPDHHAPVGTEVPPTPESQQALQAMVHRHRSMPTPPLGKSNAITTRPPRPPSHAGASGAPAVPPPPRVPGPTSPAGPSSPAAGASPLPATPGVGTSPEARTIGAGMEAPLESLTSSEPPGDTPPATPIALEATGRRSSSPANPDPSEAPAPGAAASNAHVPTVPPSCTAMTQPSATMHADFENLKAKQKKMRLALIAGGAVGGLVMLVLLGLVIRMVLSHGEPATAAASATASQGPSSSVASAPPVPPTAAPAEPGKPASACVYRGPRKRLVIGASKDVPIEVWSAPDERSIAVGFAAQNGTALGFVLDPKTVSPKRSYSKKPAPPIVRVVPVREDGRISFETNAENASASVHHPLTVPTEPPVRLGTFKNALTIGSDADSVPNILWSIPFDDEIEAVRSIPTGAKGFGLVFRAQDALWLGWVSHERKLVGTIHRIPDTGIKVGTPSIGWNGKQALIAFANLRKAKEPWTIRMARMNFGDTAKASFEWAVPEGGPGGAAIAPTVRGLADGRWIVVWTEGESGARRVRAQTYDRNMIAVGDPFDVSRSSANAGQGMAVVGKDGGAVFYLSIVGNQYEVWGAGIACP